MPEKDKNLLEEKMGEKKVTVLLVGIGGYGGVYLEELLHRSRGELYRIVGAADPYADRSKYMEELRSRGIPVYGTVEEFYREQRADLAIIATPIYLHGCQARYCMEHGSDVLCEKPVCATLDEAGAMMAVRNRTGHRLAIGFQWCYSDSIRRLKQDILEGRYGKLRRIRTVVFFPRNVGYFKRSSGWSGKRRLDSGEWVLDCVASNAAAHYLQNMLYLAGSRMERSGEPVFLQAEVYRANEIEMYDTCAFRIQTAENVELLFYATHAVPADWDRMPEFILEGEQGTVVLKDNSITGMMEDGHVIKYGKPCADSFQTLDYVRDAICGGEALPCGVETALPHLKCVCHVAESFPSPPVFPEDVLKYDEDADQFTCEGLGEALERCWQEGKLPYELQVSWACPPHEIPISPYRYSPTATGFRIRLDRPEDSQRKVVCPLFPENRKSNVFNGEELERMDLYPFRPVIYSLLTPRFYLDMHSLSGLSGYGRFVLVTENGVRWLDECDEVETEYVNGEMRYCVRDHSMPGSSIRVSIIGTTGAVGVAGRVDLCGLEGNARVYFVYGGMLSWNYHSPYLAADNRDMCWGNVVSLHGSIAKIGMDEKEWEFAYSGLHEIPYNENDMSKNRAWYMLEHWKREITVHVEGAQMRIAPPEGLIAFDEKELEDYGSAYGALSCAALSVGSIQYFAVGRGERIEKGALEELFEASRREGLRIGQSLVVRSGDDALDGAIRIGAYPTHALYGDSGLMHGALSWRYGYLGWRAAYGPLGYGLFDQVYRHFDNHFKKTWITEGVDKGAFMHMLEEAAPDAVTFYNMYETFIDQAKYYWEYTGDEDFARRLLPMVEGCIEREIRRLKPGGEWLFENSLNTWISDSHWSILGQCTQASAYMYNMIRLASDLADTKEKRERYRRQAENVKEDLFRLLWQKRKGVFGYARDLSGSQLFHPEPELADVYHTAEFGLTDRFQTYQMLDWVEANLRQEQTGNGGKLYWSSNWHPNSGRKLTHSTYLLCMGEEMNLALTYFLLGLVEPGYEIFKSSYMGIYGAKDAKLAKTENCTLQEVAADFPCQLNEQGTSMGNPQFGDSVSMFGRTAHEGVLGVRPMLHIGEVWLSPCIPEELPGIDVKSAVIDYHYQRGEEKLSLHYAMKREGCTLRAAFYLPVAEVLSVETEGRTASWYTEPGFCGVQVRVLVENADEGSICVHFAAAQTPPIEERRRVKEQEAFSLDYPGETVEELIDPQGIAENVRIAGGQVQGTAAGGEGSGVFFLRMHAGRAEYIRPVKLWIEPKASSANPWRGYQEEFEGPYEWEPIDMEGLFNASSPAEALDVVNNTVMVLPKSYNQVNRDYYKIHLTSYNTMRPGWETSDERWRSLVGEDGMAMTGEGIPFRSKKEGMYMAATTLASTAYPDRVMVQMEAVGRAVYLLITGITFPMQSHVENLRVTFLYEDGVREEHPLVNPTDIGDMWFTLWYRFHDTPNNGFENIGGRRGEMSSKGLDLDSPIPTDTEAHILRFRLRPGRKVRAVEMRTIANDAIFALMGITVLK